MSVATVQAAWKTALETANIKAYTPNLLPYEYTEGSSKEHSALLFEQEVNFIEYVVSERHEFIEIGNTTAAAFYEVKVSYTREKDTEGDNYQAIRNFFSTLLSTVSTSLTNTWTNTVDLYNPPTGAINIDRTTVMERQCFRGETIYTAQKRG
jgi:hypothetical protein